jgi:hypothetical protein
MLEIIVDLSSSVERLQETLRLALLAQGFTTFNMLISAKRKDVDWLPQSFHILLLYFFLLLRCCSYESWDINLLI